MSLRFYLSGQGVECAIQYHSKERVLDVTELGDALARQEAQHDAAHAVAELQLHVGVGGAARGGGKEEVYLRLVFGRLISRAGEDVMDDTVLQLIRRCPRIIGGKVHLSIVGEVEHRAVLGLKLAVAVGGEVAGIVQQLRAVGVGGGDAYRVILRPCGARGAGVGCAVGAAAAGRAGAGGHGVDNGVDTRRHRTVFYCVIALFFASCQQEECRRRSSDKSDFFD